ncbi:hypothetical protein [Pinirhizobacter sp.]|jgi:hypothetical protein|uniref:hypothetical protein n=1 Tax=Pinirhizobacter sp. TaxID=2950432 RepID=UPI002F408A85
MRILIAGILGGIVMFIWGAFAHMATPLGEAGFAQPVNEDIALAALKVALPPGRHAFLLPSPDPEHMGDATATKALAEKTTREPFAFVVFRSEPRDMTAMGKNLVVQWLGDTLCALFLAFVLASAAMSFCRRLIIAGLMGLFGVMANVLPFGNWYSFPPALVHGTFLDQLVGWLLAGAAMAWWLGRGAKLRGDYIACRGKVS